VLILSCGSRTLSRGAAARGDEDAFQVLWLGSLGRGVQLRRRRRKKKKKKKKKEPCMTIRKMTRNFRYSGLLLPDPAPDLDVESVRNLYAASYPEITTAALTGPEAVDGALVYTFTTAIGTKG
jgi:PRTRC genetic system protein C